MPAIYLASHPCENACGELETDRRHLGAPVYRCPGCDSEWVEEREITELEPEDAPRP